MTDAQIITWIAEHFIRFRYMGISAYLDYIDREGCEVTVSVNFPNGSQTSCEKAFRTLINKVANDQ